MWEGKGKGEQEKEGGQRKRDSTLLRGPAAFQDISTCTSRQVEATAWQSRAGVWVPTEAAGLGCKHLAWGAVRSAAHTALSGDTV